MFLISGGNHRRAPPVRLVHRQPSGEGGRRYTGNGCNLFQNLVLHAGQALRLGDFSRRHRDGEGLHILGSHEPGLDIPQRLETPNHQAKSPDGE